MKKITLFIGIISAVFVSCFETEEKIVINADKSGIYNIIINLNGMMSQLGALSGESTGKDNPEIKDSVIYFKDYTDTSTALSAEEKALLHDGSMTIHINEVADEMKFTVSVPFKNAQQLPTIKRQLVVAMDKVKMTKQLLDEPGTGGLDGMEQKGTDAALVANPVDSAFLWSMKGTTITNTLKDSSFVDHILSSNENLQAMKQIAPMFGEINYKTTYVLPSPVKKYKGSNTWLSDDRKTISFRTSLTELFDKPSTMEYELNY